MSKPERILTRHYKNGIINARADDDPWRYPASSALIPAGEGEYIRADLCSLQQEKDIDALMAERDALRAVLRAILDAYDRGQGVGFSEVMDRAHAALANKENDE